MLESVDIREFLQNKTLAMVGVSRSEKKFSYKLYKEMKDKGYKIYPINPNAKEIDGEKCYDSLQLLPNSVNAVLIVTPPIETEKVVNEAIVMGIKNIWLQQGAESQGAINLCIENRFNVIYKQCILMYAEPRTFPHNLHFHINKVLGRIPS